MSTVTIVIPAYNEEDRIVPTLRDLTENIADLNEILVVTDGTDNTDVVAKSFGSVVRVLKYPSKLGRGGAILEGLKYSSSDVVCFIDADNSVPWYEVNRLSRLVDSGHPCVIGSRWVRDSKILGRESMFKIVAGRWWHYLVYAVLGIEAKDVQCGMKCFSKELLEEVLPMVVTTNRLIDVDLIYRIRNLDYPVKEVGIEWKHEPNSRMPYLHVIPVMFVHLIGLKLSNMKRFKKTSKAVQNLLAKVNKFH